MQELDLIEIFVEPMAQAQLDYMISGSVASMIYGQPRMTHDIDIIINVAVDKVDLLTAIFPLKDFYCPPVEVMRLEIGRDTYGHFNIIHHHSGFKADIYPASDWLHRWGLGHKNMITLAGKTFNLARPEYVILRKLQYYRQGGSQKHLIDIQSMLDFAKEKIDMDFLLAKVKELALVDQWQAIRL